MNRVMILGRCADDDQEVSPDPRAAGELVFRHEIGFTGGANGLVKLEMFRSIDEEDRGGITLRLLIVDHGQAFIPHARDVENGAELHIAGAIEAKTVLRALKSLVSSIDTSI